jgi:ABC-2 type transport system permease protein
MVTWTLAKKDLRLLVRDARAVVILLVMPVVFIFVLGVSLGENFGKKSSDLRVSVLVLDRGLPPAPRIKDGMSWLALTPVVQAASPGMPVQILAGMSLAAANYPQGFPHEPWAEVVLRDLAETADISVEKMESLEQAKEMVGSGRRAAVLVLGPNFSKRVALCSFLPDGINPFFRDGVRHEELDVRILRDETQQASAAIIEQVAQGTMLRIVLPWMIGRAFAKIGDPAFIDLLSKENVQVPTPLGLTLPLKAILKTMTPRAKQELGNSLQNALQKLYPKYNLTAKTWAALTKSVETGREGAAATAFREDGAGWLKFGAQRYQLLVPSYLVMFAFFLVLTVGWLFVAERRQGTMKRLCAAPLSRTQILLGKLLPCFALSLFQGFFLLAAGKLIFGMNWGPQPLWLVPVVATTSLAAMGLALLVAALAQTETQVAIYGTLLVLVLAGLSGMMMGDRALMPQRMQEISNFTPHAWALDAYKQLLANPGTIQLNLVIWACLVLAGFGVAFTALAWWFLKLEN